jgi:2-polyprenyl-3-methyl-5-hydroxy-6-metoxy-1,4-benzoquinol methylase
VIPELMKSTNTMLLEHTARYYFSTPYVRGRVLDMACGAGFGTHMVAKLCKEQLESIIGADIDPEIIEYARGTYYHPLSRFVVADVRDPHIVEKLGQFDTILSFETLEHLEDDRGFVRQLYDLLKPGGMLVISTPFGRGRGIPCGQPFHHHQLTREEFETSFVMFEEVEFYYQRGVTIEPERRDVYYPIGVAVCRK